MKRITAWILVVALMIATMIVSVGATETSTDETDAYILAISELIEVRELVGPEGTTKGGIDLYVLPVGGSISLKAKTDGVGQQIRCYDENNQSIDCFGMGAEGQPVYHPKAMQANETVSYVLQKEDSEHLFMSIDVLVDDASVSYYFTVEDPVDGDPTSEVRAITTAIPTPSKLWFDGKVWELAVYNIDGYNYFKLRDIAFALNDTDRQFSVGWSEEEDTISLRTEEAYTVTGGEAEPLKVAKNVTVRATRSRILVNEEPKAFVAYLVNGHNYFKLRDLAAEIDFAVGYNEVTKEVSVDSTRSYQE